MPTRAFDDDQAWADIRGQWRLRTGTIYLNHGSFGPSPLPVQRERRRWQDQLDQQPMDFFTRQFEPAWSKARGKLANFIGAEEDNVAFVENATAAMNAVAQSIRLRPGDEVLLTDHEYGAVRRIWRRACERAGARKPVIAELPRPLESAEQLVDALFAAATDRTRLLVVSHITSPTAVILPVELICRRAKERDIAVCIDGPHAVAQLPLRLDELGCDFYTASCHKWLSAPFGSGFLYVAPHRHEQIQPPHLSWGRLLPNRPEHWWEEFLWTGTRDPSPYFATSAAIEFLQQIGLDAFRRRTHQLACYARRRLLELIGLPPLTPDSEQWFGSMVVVPLPPGDANSLQSAIWQRRGIEVPIVDWAGQRWLRVSCHLYNTHAEIDTLAADLRKSL